MSATLLGFVAVASLLANRWTYLRGRNASWDAPRHVGMSLIVVGWAMILVALADPRFPASILVAAVVLVGVAAYDAGDLASLYFFDDRLSDNLRHLPLLPKSPNAFKLALASLRAYFPFRRFLASSLTLLAALIVAMVLRPPLAASARLAALLVVAGLWLRRARRGSSRSGLSAVDWRILTADEKITTAALRRADRSGSFALSEPPAFLPDGILIVVLESAGGHLRSVSNPALSLTERIVESSGVADQWLCPTNMVANSSCTDIVLPALLTGAAPHESAETLHRLPFVFDLAKARGYQTAFFTSTSMNWVNFHEFFGAARIDELFAAEDSGLPFINDTSVDDHAIVGRLGRWLDNVDGRFFALHYSNALHSPFQTESEVAIPPRLTDRRARAAYVVEKQLETLFAGLARSGRLDRTLILVLGDHGEVAGEPREGDAANWNRLYVLHEKVVRPLIALKPPTNFPIDLRQALEANLDALICDIDFAPTLARLFGAELGDGLRYAGCNLFEPVPPDRIAYVLNTNEWRNWSKSAAAIFRGRSSAIIDYLDRRLCRSGDEDRPGPAYSRDELLRAGFAEPLVRKTMAKIYKAKVRRR